MNAKQINAIIIDDEHLGRKNLQLLLANFCPEVRIIETFDDPNQAYSFLKSNEIDLIFLDISMPNLSGFEFLQLFPKRNFEVVFVSAYEDFGIQAFRANAVDYLTKPISVVDLQEAVQRVMSKLSSHQTVARPNTKLLSVSHADGTNIINTDDIVYLAADDYLTTFYLVNQPKIVVAKTIKYFEEMLAPQQFARIHKSFIININFIDSYSKQDGGFVKLKHAAVVLPISRRKMGSFLDLIAQNVRH